MNTYGVATSGRYLHAVCAVIHKEILKGAARKAVGVLKDPPVVNWKDTGGMIPVDRNTVGIPPQNHYPSLDWYWTLCPPN